MLPILSVFFEPAFFFQRLAQDIKGIDEGHPRHSAQFHGLDKGEVRFSPGTENGGEDGPEQDVKKAGKPALRGQEEPVDGEDGPGYEPDPDGQGLMHHGAVNQASEQSAVGYDEEEVAAALEARVVRKLGPYGEAH